MEEAGADAGAALEAVMRHVDLCSATMQGIHAALEAMLPLVQQQAAVVALDTDARKQELGLEKKKMALEKKEHMALCNGEVSEEDDGKAALKSRKGSEGNLSSRKIHPQPSDQKLQSTTMSRDSFQRQLRQQACEGLYESPAPPLTAPPVVQLHVPDAAQEEEAGGYVSEAGRCEGERAFELLPFYAANNNYSHVVTLDGTRRGKNEPKQDDDEDEEHFEFYPSSKCARMWMLHPSSQKRALWDILSIILVVWDVIILPMEFFNPPESAFILVMVWVTRCFWTLDIPVSFSTGVILRDGIIDMRPYRVAVKYMKSWLLLDCVVVGCDWFEEIMSAQNSGVGVAKFGRASRVMRMLRMVRLLRLLKMGDVVKQALEHITSDVLLVVADVVKIVVVLVAFAHVNSCGWYAISFLGEAPRTWVVQHNYTREKNMHLSEVEYLLHVSAIFISQLTCKMTQLSLLNNSTAQGISNLRRYLTRVGISRKLALRVQRNAAHTLQEHVRCTPESKVALLSIVSEPLRVEIHYEMHSVLLKCHLAFQMYDMNCPRGMRKVCHSATDMLYVSSGDVIFAPREISRDPKMFFVRSGNLTYTAAPASTCAGKATMVRTSGPASTQSVTANTFVSEPALWTTWRHCGELKAEADSCLMVLRTERFAETIREFDQEDFNWHSYAYKFVTELNNLEEHQLSDLHIFREKALLGVDAGRRSTSATRRTSVSFGAFRIF
eukprot:TRINITY_DN4861_c0_g1_i8.p1 TRINITY_DN4861_c0_g1~~TRINITY_DN4861_c0_g1_i8.p1  ORF type:complete len:722 (-),score=157.78 TRINITY_DN4861_c0_g1_i8:83-2248(-)